jgi:formate-dependent nitrite reductase cytochrome c552 subunit
VDVGSDWKTGPCADCHNTPPEAKAAEKPKVVSARTPSVGGAASTAPQVRRIP